MKTVKKKQTPGQNFRYGGSYRGKERAQGKRMDRREAGASLWRNIGNIEEETGKGR